MTGSLTAVLLPLTMAAPALAVDGTVDTTATTAASTLTDSTAAAWATAATAVTATSLTTDATGAAVAPVATPATGTTPDATAPADSAGTATSFRAAPPALAAVAPAAVELASTAMRISAARIGADGTSRIGVRLLTGSATLAGQAVTVQSQTANGWVEVRRLRTDREGLAVGHLPFRGRTAVRAVFEGTATHAASTSATAPVQPRVVVQARAAVTSIGLRAVQLAARQAGKPYRYGSTGPSSFDCSGFTTYIFNTQLGKRLPRTSAAQAAALPKVAPSAKQPGDLLFFRTGGRVSHVGIYAGGGKMWAAPTRGDRVKLQSIYSSRYSVGRVV